MTLGDWLGDLFLNSTVLLFVLFCYTITGVTS